MGEELEEIKRFLIDIFSNLSDDPYFEITSSATPNYNCIAWACNYSDRWIQPTYLRRPSLDCVVWWPPEVTEGIEPPNLKELFEFHGYVECNSGEFEEGYRKVGIFQKTVKVVYNYNACLLTGDSNPVKTSFYPEVKSAHMATLLHDDLPPFPSAF